MSNKVLTKDGVEIFYKDWGPKDAQPLVFHHGWPLSSDDWDAQMLFFLANGYRVIAHDRRGHGRSSQVGFGHDMDHYAADASAVVEHLDLKNAVHIGHSTGGGEVARYVAKFGQPQGRVAKAVFIAAVPPLMVKSDKNPGVTPLGIDRDCVACRRLRPRCSARGLSASACAKARSTTVKSRSSCPTPRRQWKSWRRPAWKK